MQERRDAAAGWQGCRKKGCMKGGIHERRDSGDEGSEMARIRKDNNFNLKEKVGYCLKDKQQ